MFIYRNEENKRKARSAVYEKLDMNMDTKARRGDGSGKACVLPTRNNPFMNVLMSDYTDFPNRPSACNTSNKVVKKKMVNYAGGSVPRNVDDVHGKQGSELFYHTMPSTSIPNDQTDFAKWCYSTGISKKETGVLALDR
jgi:hypothetical protein